MNLIKPKKISVLHKPHRFKGEDRFVISPMCVFTLSSNPEILEDPKKIQFAHTQVLDYCMPKGKSEFIIVGSAYSPTGDAIKEMTVSARVADLYKQLYVVGDKTYRKSVFAYRHFPSEDKSFKSIALNYKNAFGDRSSSCNIDGKGFIKKGEKNFIHGANIFYEKPKKTVSDDIKMPGAAFSPVNINCQNKISLAGTYDKDWLTNGYPNDIDFSFFNQAAEDQQTSRYFRAGDEYRLEGMHPTRSVISGQLPNIAFRVFVQFESENEDPSVINELVTDVDTVWFFPDENVGVMLGRALTPVNDTDALDVKTLMVAYEEVSDDVLKRPLSHYENVLKCRTDPKQALKHVFNEEQLSPIKSDKQLQEIKQLRKDYHLQQEKTNKLREKKIHSLIWPKSECKDKDEPLSDELKFDFETTPTPNEIESGDFDLSPFIEFTEKAIERERKNAIKAKEKSSRLIDKAKRMEHRDEGKINQGVDESLQHHSCQATMSNYIPPLEKIKKSGEIFARTADAGQIEQVFSEVSQSCEGLSRQYLVSESTAKKIDWSKRNCLKRKSVVKRIEGKESFVGLNLSKINLSGLNFSGLDLSGCDLSNSDLSEAIFRDCIFFDSTLYECYAESTDFRNSHFKNCNMSGLSGLGANFSNCKFEGGQWNHALLTESVWKKSFLCSTTFYDVECKLADFSQSTIKQVTLIKSNLDKSNFSKSNLNTVNITQCELKGVSFIHSVLSGVAWVQSHLQYSDYSNTKVNKCTALENNNFSYTNFLDARFSGCGFSGVNFTGSAMTGGCFAKSNFSRANFRSSTMEGASFAFSILSEADFTDCQAEEVDFMNGLCRKTNFENSNLTCSQFHGADLFEACFKNTTTDNAQLHTLISDSRSKNYILEVDNHGS